MEDASLGEVAAVLFALPFLVGVVVGALVKSWPMGFLGVSAVPLVTGALLAVLLATDEAAWEDGFSALFLIALLLVAGLVWIAALVGWVIARSIRALLRR